MRTSPQTGSTVLATRFRERDLLRAQRDDAESSVGNASASSKDLCARTAAPEHCRKRLNRHTHDVVLRLLRVSDEPACA